MLHEKSSLTGIANLREMEDEGYTSPSDEDFRYEPNQHSPRFTVSNACARNEPDSTNEEESVPWEIVAKLPYTKNCHLCWDDIQVPLAYRFQKQWNFQSTITSKRLRKSAYMPYLTDSVKKSNEVVDLLWRSWDIKELVVDETLNDVPSKKSNDCVCAGEQPVNCISEGASVLNDIRNANVKLVYITLDTFLQNVLNLLAGRGSQTFILVRETMQFKKNPIILLHGIGPTTLANYCKNFLECGSLVTKFNTICRLHDVSLGSEEGRNSGMVFNTCVEFISNYLKLYQTVLMLKGPTIRTLTRLKTFIKPFHNQLRTLENVFDTLSNGGSALDLITGLNFLLASQETPYIEDMMRSLFITCTTTYYKYVSNWVFRGKLGPPSEFHIESGREHEYSDRRFWTKLFIQKNATPLCLEQSAPLIFETGKSIHLLNRIQKTISKGTHNFCNETDSVIKPQLTFESLKQLVEDWRVKETNFFDENAYLKSSLDATIKNVIDDAFKILNIDLTNVEQIQVENIKRIKATKIKMHLMQQTKSRKLMRDLKEQINIANERKSRDESLPLYQRIKLKYHLAQETDRVLEENLDHYNSGGDIPMESDAIHDANSNSNDHIKSPHSLDLNFETQPTGIFGRGHGDVPTKSISALQESLLDDQVLTENKLSSSTADAESDEVEEKFNPDKIIVSQLPKYKFDYSEEFKKPLEPFQRMAGYSTSLVKQYLRYDPYCLNYFLSQSVLIPLSAQNKMTNATLLHHLIVDNNLFRHVSSLNSFLCLQNGLFSYNLTAMLIQGITNGYINNNDDLFRRTAKLNIILNKALSIATSAKEADTFTSSLSFSIDESALKTEKQTSTNTISKFSSLNSVRLTYTVGWPLNIILTDDLLSNYEKLFVFLMQIIRAEMLLDRIFSVINFKKIRSKQLDTIHYCRYRMLHFVRTVRNYVNVTVIDSAWNDLCGLFMKMDSLDIIYDSFVKHIKSICSNCLHGAKAERLLKLLTDQLVIIENFCDHLENINVDWEKGEEVPLPEFKKLIQNFLAAEQIGKVFMNVAWKMVQKGYYPKVDYFLKLYNFNEFFSQDIPTPSFE